MNAQMRLIVLIGRCVLILMRAHYEKTGDNYLEFDELDRQFGEQK